MKSGQDFNVTKGKPGTNNQSNNMGRNNGAQNQSNQTNQKPGHGKGKVSSLQEAEDDD